MYPKRLINPKNSTKIPVFTHLKMTIKKPNAKQIEPLKRFL